MKWIVWILAVVVTVVAASLAAGWCWRARSEPKWTTESPQALKELELGFDAMMKHYEHESKAHFNRAVELDPGFAMAKLGQLSFTYEPTERERLLAELRKIDLAQLTPRERFMIEFYVARFEGDQARARAILERYYDKHPNDVFAVEARCELAWEAESWDEAESCYHRMLKLEPSWVDAQHRLGYISMARGNLDEAEERFRTFRFIAPDQALPHDALGELLTLRGEYAEAEQAFDAALEVKADFCDAYRHRLRLFIYSGQLDRAETALSELAALEACNHLEQWGYSCQVRTWLENVRGDYEAAWGVGTSPECMKTVSYKHHLHHAAILTGRFLEAIRFEDELRQHIDKKESVMPKKLESDRAMLLHMQGVRELAQGATAAATKDLAAADALLTYWERDQGTFKQLNRVSLVRSLEKQGRLEEARAIWSEVKAVNPSFGAPSEAAAHDPLAAWNGPAPAP